MTRLRARVTATGVVAALTCGVCLLLGQRVAAQGSQAYVSAGAGATDLSGGVDILLPALPVAVGGEFGVGNLLWSSLTVSYHPLARRPAYKVDPFARVSATAVGSSPYEATGVSVGGGLTFALGRRLGVRTEAVKFWPTFNEDVVSSEPPFTPRLWAVRAGLALRW